MDLAEKRENKNGSKNENGCQECIYRSIILLVALYNNILCPIFNIETSMHCFSVVTEVQSDVSHIHNMGVTSIINPHRKA